MKSVICCVVYITYKMTAKTIKFIKCTQSQSVLSSLSIIIDRDQGLTDKIGTRGSGAGSSSS